jgi:hypothetical protein
LGHDLNGKEYESYLNLEGDRREMENCPGDPYKEAKGHIYFIDNEAEILEIYQGQRN